MKMKERLAIPRQMPQELAPSDRITNFFEVVANFDYETAVKEADRCLQCKKPLCSQGCPLNNNIPEFIGLLRENKIEEAYWKIREKSSLPAVCSRVCPHEFQCEGSCVRGKKGEPVSIGMLERYVADWMVVNKKNMMAPCALPNGKKVAIIGSGPAGMTAAYHLAHEGFACTIFESMPIVGGMLTLGIPSYRLPRNIVNKEFDALKNCGVDIITDIVIGKDKSLQDLRDEGYEAIFIGVGAHNSRKLGIEGEDLDGVMHGVDYLREVNLGKPVRLGTNVVVVGGGNVAIDVARTALRTGSENVFILYRRSKAEMPASSAEINHLEEEGVKIEMLAAPVKIHGDNGKMTKVECVRMELGEPDDSGRCRPVVKEGSNFMIDADAIIPAISQDVDLTAKAGVDIETTSWNTLIVNNETMETNVDWIFAGGDAVLGPQTAAKAVWQGKVAATSMKNFLETK